jgi:hypothetical protein
MNTKPFFASSVVVASLGVTSLAQQPNPQIEQSRLSGSQAPGARGPADTLPSQSSAPSAITSGTTGGESSAPGDDFGDQLILKRKEKPTPFSAYATISGNYTNNVTLQRRGGTSDEFLLGEVGVAWAQSLKSGVTLDVGLRQQAFRYNKTTAFDFENLNLSSGVVVPIPYSGGVLFTGRYNYTRLTDAIEHDEFLTNHTLTAGLLKIFPINSAVKLSLGYSSEFAIATYPQAQAVNIHSASAGLNVAFTRSLSAQAFYRVGYSDYTELNPLDPAPVHRADWNQMVGFGLNYKLTKQVNINSTVGYAANQSNGPQFEYSAINAAVSLGAFVKF